MKRRAMVGLMASFALIVVAGMAVTHRADDGPVVGVIPVQDPPTAAAVADRTGRAFVLDNADSSAGVVDMATGALLPTVPVGYGPIGLAVDARRDRVFVAGNGDSADGYQGSVDILDGSGGRPPRRVTLPGDVKPLAIAADARAGLVYVANKERVLHDFVGVDARVEGATVDALDAANGRPLRAVTLAAGYTPVAVAADEAGGRAYVIGAGDTNTPSGMLSVIDGRGGRVLRVAPLRGSPAAVAIAASPARGGAPAGRILVTEIGMGGGPPYSRTTVEAFDAASGRRIQAVTVPSGPGVSAIDAGAGRLYTLRSNGPLGIIVPPPAGGAGARVTPPFMRGTIKAYVPPSLGGLNVLDARTGASVGSIVLAGDPLALAVDAAAGRAIVPTIEYAVHDGGVVRYPAVDVVDLRGGAVRRTIPIGEPMRLDWSATSFQSGGPGEVIAVDARTGRALIAAGGYTGQVNPPDPWGWVPAWLRGRLPFAVAPAPRIRSVGPRLIVLDPSK